MGGEHRVGLARHRAFWLVHDGGDVLALRPGITQGRQRVGGLAGLRDEEREPARRHVGGAIAEFRGDIDLAGHARDLLDPVFRDQRGVIGGAASNESRVRDLRQIEGQVGQMHGARRRVNELVERVAHRHRLLEDLLLHVVRVIALARGGAAERGLLDGALDHAALRVAQGRARGGHHRPVALLEIKDAPGEGRQGERVRADEHLAIAESDRQGAAAPRADRGDRVGRRTIAPARTRLRGVPTPWRQRRRGQSPRPDTASPARRRLRCRSGFQSDIRARSARP